MWDTIQGISIHIAGETEKKFQEKVIKNFPYLMKNINLCIKELQWTPSRVNAKKFTCVHAHYSQMLKAKDEENTGESHKRKMTHYVQGKSNKINS